MKGAGLARYGLCSAGFGDLDTTNPQFSLWKMTDGTQGTARNINTITGNYSVNSDGFFVGMDEVDQQVYLALVTIKGSASDTLLGQTFSRLQIISGNYKQQITAMVNNALSDLVSSKTISINNISVIQDTNSKTRIGIKVDWTDTTNNISKSTSV